MLAVLLSDGSLATSLATLLFKSHFFSLYVAPRHNCSNKLLFGGTNFPARDA